jgi:predicted MPP superfamily phosphohydrolase
MTTAGVGLYTCHVEPQWVELVRRSLAIRDLPSSLEGRTLVQFSDIHVGREVDDDYLKATFRRVQALRPDIVVITGDLITYHRDIGQQMASVYEHFPKGRLATIATLGNHDYGPGWRHPKIAAHVAKTISKLGITVIRNQVCEIHGLHFVGMDDLWAHRFQARQTLSQLPRGAPALVLSHNPDSVDERGWDGYKGWILSGHTHGGQCKLPYLPPPLLPVANKRYTCGEFLLDDARRLYVSRGLGHLLHVRFNVRPEVTVFQLLRA